MKENFNKKKRCKQRLNDYESKIVQGFYAGNGRKVDPTLEVFPAI